MGRKITIRVSGRAVDTDAPTADDLLDQIKDYLDILRGVEAAIAADGQNAIDWRVVNARMQSPILFELEAFPKQFAVNVDRRAARVTRQTARGLESLQRSPRRPHGFTDAVVKKAERVFERVTNGLSLSEITLGPELPTLTMTPAVARGAVKNAQLVLSPVEKPYREFGTAEGLFQSVERDGHNRKLLYIRHRLSGETVKCVLSNEAAASIEQHLIADVYANRRVLVHGIIQYRGLGRIREIEAVSVEFLRGRHELPGIDDILDEDFTSGLSTEDYLERLRDGRL